MTALLGTDWHVEPEDTSVGIFGHAIYHETCDLDEAAEASDEVTRSYKLDDLIFDVHTVTCPCGTSTTYTESVYDPIEEI